MPITPNSLTPQMVAKLFAERADDTSVLLITISHPSWDDDLRLSTSNKDFLYEDALTHYPVGGFISNGQQYLFVGMKVSLPSSSQEQAPRSTLTFSNVSQKIAAKIKIVDVDYPVVSMQLVTFFEPDTVEQEFTDLQAEGAGYDGTEGTLTLINDVAENEPTPGHIFNPFEWFGVREF